MEDYKLRVKAKMEKLFQRKEALSDFIYNNPILNTIGIAERERLYKKLEFMDGYYNVLEQRFKIDER